MNKWIFSLIISLLLLAPLPVNADESVKSEEPTKEITILNRLGITNIDIQSGYDENEVVTRAKFIEYVAKSILATPVKDVMYFYDVPNDHWAAGSINAMLEYGIISLSSDKRFYPDRPITYNQACKIMLFAAGYKEVIAYGNSEDMTVYALTAAKVGIKTPVKDANALTINEVVRLLYNGLAVERMDGVSGKKSVAEDDTLFSVYHNIYMAKGVITSVFAANMEGSRRVSENQVVIDGEVFELFDDLSVEEMFGCYVEYVYRKDKEGYHTLYYAEPIISKNNELLLDSRRIESFDVERYMLSYYQTGANESVISEDIDRTAVIILNGRPYSGRLSTIIEDFVSGRRKGYIRLLDRDGNSDYEILIIKSYEVFIVGGYDSTQDILYYYEDHQNQLRLGDYKNVRILNEYGDAANLPSQFPAVISIAKTYDGENIEIIVCQNKIAGTVKSCDSEGIVSFDEVEFIDVDKFYWDRLRTKLVVGDKVTVILDQFGEIVYVDTEVIDEMIPVYLIDIGSSGTLGSTYEFRVYSRDSSIKIYKLAKTVIADKIRYKEDEHEIMLKGFPGSSTEIENGREVIKIDSQVIRIRLNKAGEITEIDTMNVCENEDKDYTLTRKHDGSVSLLWTTQLKRFGLDVLYSSTGTKLFVVPPSSSSGGAVQEEQYKSTYTFVHDKYYYIETYQYNYDNFYTDIIVLHIESQIENETCFMLSSITKGINKDGDALYKLNGYANGGKISFFVDESAEKYLVGLNEGDILRVDTDFAGTKVVNIVQMFNASTMKFENANKNEYWYGGTYDKNGQYAYRGVKYQLSKGHAYDVKSNIIKVTYDEDDLARGVINEVTDIANTTIMVCDRQKARNKIYVGTLNDIIHYKLAEANCSVVLLNTRYTVLKQIFVYK